MEIESLNKEIKNIINLLEETDDEILHDKIKDNKVLTEKLFNLHKKIFILNLKIHQLELKYPRDEKVKILIKKMDFILENFNLLNDFNKEILQQNKKRAIDTLTIVNTIFLPLALITGFYGMNFKSMGVPSLKKGVFTIKHAQRYIFFLFLFFIIIILIIFYFNILPS